MKNSIKGNIDMKIALSSENTVDLSAELVQKCKLNTISFGLILGTEEKKGNEVKPQEIFDFVKETKILPKTSALNDFQYGEYFESLLKDNDYVIHICLSSKLTSSTSNAMRVSHEERFEGKVFVIDSMSLSTGSGLLVLYAHKLINSNKEVKEIVKLVQEKVTQVQASFIVERLDYLAKGGRCNMLQLLGANLLKIRPQLILKEGNIVLGKKYRGPMPKCVKDYVNDILNEFPNIDKENVFITYSSATPEMIEEARKILIENNFKNIYETTAGSIVSSHCGENTIGVLYLCK